MSDVPPGVSAERALAVWGWQRESLIIDELEQLLADAAFRRDAHVRALHDTELSYRDIGDLLGVSPARVGQIMARIRGRLPREKDQR